MNETVLGNCVTGQKLLRRLAYAHCSGAGSLLASFALAAGRTHKPPGPQRLCLAGGGAENVSCFWSLLPGPLVAWSECSLRMSAWKSDMCVGVYVMHVCGRSFSVSSLFDLPVPAQ